LRSDVEAVVDVPPRVEAVETAVQRVDPGTAGANRQVLRISGGTPRWMDSPNFFGRDYLSGNAAENASPKLAQMLADIQTSSTIGVNGGNIQLEKGEYRLTETLDLTRFTGRIGGIGVGKSAGYFDSTNSTVFRW